MNRWTLFVNREPSFVWANSSHFETRIKRVPEYVHTTRNVSHVRTCFFMLLWQRWCFFLCLPGMTFQMPAPALTFQTSKSNGTPKSLLIILCVQKKIYIYIPTYIIIHIHIDLNLADIQLRPFDSLPYIPWINLLPKLCFSLTHRYQETWRSLQDAQGSWRAFYRCLNFF